MLRTIYKEEDVKIDEALGGAKHKKRVAIFEERDESIIACLQVYAEQKDPEAKLRQLHILAAKMTLGGNVLVDIQDENCPSDED